MTDRRGRPTLPLNLKAGPVTSTSISGVNQPSATVRDAAARAFNSRPPSSPTQTAKPVAKAISNGARSAAAAAGGPHLPISSPPESQNASKAGAAAYARGRMPAGVERNILKDNVHLSTGSRSTGPSPARQNAMPVVRSSSQIAARMASTSRSPARVSPLRNLDEVPPLPQDQSALLASKLASLRSHHDTQLSGPNHSVGSSTVDHPVLDLKNIPPLSRKVFSQPSQDSKSSTAAGAAAAHAALRPLKTPILSLSPGVKPRTIQEGFPFNSPGSLSPVELNFPSLEPISTMSSYASAMEAKKTLSGPGIPESGNSIHRSAPIPIKATAPRKPSPAVPPSSHGIQISEYRTGMTENTLADAIVASSLASSRASSPKKIGMAPRPARRSRSHSYPLLAPFHHEKKVDQLSPKPQPPPRTLKHTLRKQRDDVDQGDEQELVKRGRRHFMRKHPHKHHEGDRKRWRDKVTERERRRYEGVWAANRGLFMFWQDADATGFGESWKRAPEADLVANVVVRDIWERSHLPRDVLEEIWDLVANSEDAQALQRDQFVVGLWLLDQRLKGRKLPVRVSSDVWASVRHTQGVKISRKPY